MIRARYRAALWKLRKICKEELVGQRERVVQQIKAIRDDMASRERDSRDKRRQRSSPFPDFDDDNTRDEGGLNGAGDHETAKQNESMEEDLAQLDEIIRYVRRYLNKGHDVSRREMEAFIEQADRIEDEAQCLAMKDYGIVEQHVTFKKEKENEPPAAPTSTSASVQPSSLPPTQYQKQTDLGSLLRVKDQMIYQLLQERTAMRKERAAVEASLKKLSDVSTREMKKWARLTDDMQAEIEQLRSQLLVIRAATEHPRKAGSSRTSVGAESVLGLDHHFVRRHTLLDPLYHRSHEIELGRTFATGAVLDAGEQIQSLETFTAAAPMWTSRRSYSAARFAARPSRATE
ncbi:hypothetical protein ON010_g9600 [Phytophthora cinnamomi]|nr:hypothetical protein ON010_g9600 [Phytophthora cinnamomi]